jgi:hypothetical protein
MSTLMIRFGTWLASNDCSAKGPLFHRWLPNGRLDQLSLSSETDDWDLDLWFERHGYRDSSFIEFDLDRREVDPSVMGRQAVLDAGPLRGELRFASLSEVTLADVIGDRKGSEHYLAVGSRVRRIVDAALVKLTRLLRVQYGQYWIEPHQSFDSRRYSLGHHFSRLYAEWSTDGEQWQRFWPDEPKYEPFFLTVAAEPYDELLTESDWEDMHRLLQEEFEPELAASLLVRAHELADSGRQRHALIEAVSALEVAIEAQIRSNIGKNADLKKSIQSFWELPLPARLVVVGSTLADQKELEMALAAIKRRNAIVHDGLESGGEDGDHIRAILDVVRRLIPGQRIKLGSPNFGNELRAKAEDWDGDSTG